MINVVSTVKVCSWSIRIILGVDDFSFLPRMTNYGSYGLNTLSPHIVTL